MTMTTTSPITTIPARAIDEYMTRSARIQQQLAQLQRLADDHFGVHPDEVHWANVGDLGRVEAGLAEILAIFGADNQ